MENWDFCDWTPPPPEIVEKCVSESYRKKLEEQKLVEESDYQLTNELFNGNSSNANTKSNVTNNVNDNNSKETTNKILTKTKSKK
jgi:hypothetical protein